LGLGNCAETEAAAAFRGVSSRLVQCRRWVYGGERRRTSTDCWMLPRGYVALRSRTMADFTAKIDQWMEGTVWTTRCSNYFRATNGRVVTQWPRSARSFWSMTRRFKAADYTFDPPSDRNAVTAGAQSVANGQPSGGD
jgi:hypothetical protein